MNEKKQTLSQLPVDPLVDELYRAAPAPAPPAYLDRAVLAAARARPGRRPARWAPPLALAATVVISISLATLWLSRRQTELPAPPVPLSTDRPAAARVADRQAESDATAAGRSAGNLTSAASPGAGSPSPPPAAEPSDRPAERRTSVGDRERSGQQLPLHRLAEEAEAFGDAVQLSAEPRLRRDSAGPADEQTEQLAAIERLLHAGENAAAQEALQTFLRRFPDFPRRQLPRAVLPLLAPPATPVEPDG